MLPNSERSVGLALLVLSAILSFNKITFTRRHSILLALYLPTLAVTSLYMLVGYLRGAPNEALFQTLGAYVVTPFLWTIVFTALVQQFDINRITQWILNLSYVCMLSIILFIALFTAFGPEAVSLFKQNASVDIRDGRAAANMHVYGSLIFIIGGTFFAPGVIRSKVERYVLIAMQIAAIATSGRTAMFLAAAAGVFLRAFGTPFAPKSYRKNHRSNFGIMNLLVIAVVLVSVHLFFVIYLSIDIVQSLMLFVDDIKAGGGAVRSEQAKALWEGTLQYYALGAGHGIGLAELVRNEANPWRYELLLSATLYRVGAIGTIIYILPFGYALLKAVKLHFKGMLSNSEQFILGGYVAFLLAAGTNPYLEAISFQWMVVLPMVYFVLLDKTNPKNAAIFTKSRAVNR